MAVKGPQRPWTPATLEATLKVQICEMQERLDQAAGIGRAAKACVDADNISKAIEIALDVEQLIYEVNTFLNAASSLHRISSSYPPRQRQRPPRDFGGGGTPPLD